MSGPTASSGRSEAAIREPEAVFERARRWMSVELRAVAPTGPPLDGRDRQGSPAIGLPLDALCRVVLALDGAGILDEVTPETRAAWGEHIRSRQHARMGWFADAVHASPADESGWWAADARLLLTTPLALQALHVLDTRPVRRLGFLGDLTDEKLFRSRIEELDWANVLEAGKRVAALLVGLVHRAEGSGDHLARRRFHEALDALTRIQHPETGLWGPATATELGSTVHGAGLLVSFFRFVRRPLERVTRMGDSVLGLYRADTGPDAFGGTPERTLAATVLLAGLRASGHPAEELRGALLDLYRKVVATQREDGGFEPPASESSGSGAAEPPADGAAIAAATELARLRLATLAVVIGACPDGFPRGAPWRFRTLPGPGYHHPGGPVTERERGDLTRWLRPLPVRDEKGVAPDRTGSEPAISVVVPCFNLGRYLPEAVESVLVQTTDDYEIVIVDDGSTDELTGLVLDHMERAGIRVIRQANAGVAEARNRGIGESRGRYICCLDADDRLRPGFLARAAEVLEAEGAVGVVASQFRTFDEKDEWYRHSTCALPELLVHNPLAQVGLFRRTAWQQAGGYWEGFSVPGIEDWDLWIGILEAGYSAVILPEVLWDYRIRPDQMSSSMYEPLRWERLNRELVLRHVESYRTFLPDVVAGVSGRWAVSRKHALGEARAVSWWKQEAGRWERSARRSNERIVELEAWAEELDEAKEWWRRKSDDWRETAEKQNSRIGELEKRVAELEASPPHETEEK
jgi:glycosyltransferase involved in cell wall biosynthesis